MRRLEELRREEYDALDIYKIVICTKDMHIKIEETHILAKRNDILLLYGMPRLSFKEDGLLVFDFGKAFAKRKILPSVLNYPLLYDFFRQDQAGVEYLYFQSSQSERISRLLEELLVEEDRKLDLYFLYIILAYLGKEHTRLLSKTDSTMMKEYLLGHIIKYIDEHSKDINLQKLSDIFGYSPAYFSRFFKKEMHTSFKDMLIEIRLEKATKYLQEKRFAIQDIAKEVGYNDINHFYKIFKERYGMTPNEYKKTK